MFMRHATSLLTFVLISGPRFHKSVNPSSQNADPGRSPGPRTAYPHRLDTAQRASLAVTLRLGAWLWMDCHVFFQARGQAVARQAPFSLGRVPRC